MNLSFVKKISFPAMAGAITLILAACLNPIGLPSYGSTQGSTGGGNILPGEGRLIIKNLTRDFLVHKVSFTPLSGQDSAPDLEPGPEKSNQRSVTLPSGLWKITLIYGAGYTVSITDVMITEGSAATVYFYKTNAGRGSLETQWLPPTDADISGNANPGEVLSDDEGFLHVINRSQSSIITGVEYNNGASWIQVAIPAPAGMSGNIAAGQGSAPDLVLPRGSWAIRFRLLGKDVPTVAVSRTITAGQTVEVEYTDSLLTDRPPSGFGSLRIVNYLSGKNITRIVVRTQANDYAAEELALSGPIAHGGGSQVRALRAGDMPGSRRDYIVQCYVTADEYYEEVARVIDETISEVFITADSSKTTESGGGSATEGALTVYNRYAGRLPFKVFRIYLYRETGAGVWQDYVPPANAAYPKAPTANTFRYNGNADYAGEPFVVKGDYQTFSGLAEGAYKLLIIGGSYHWQYYRGGHTSGGIAINEKLITYDCGSVFIKGGGSKIFNFDPYISGFYDRDTPEGVVTIQFKHAGIPGTDGPVTMIQVLTASEDEVPSPAGNFYANKDAYVFGVIQSNQTVLAPQASVTGITEGGEFHNVINVKGGVIPDRFVVYQYDGMLGPMETIEFCLPPGVFAVRAFDPEGTGFVRDRWYGRDGQNYCDLHIAHDAGKTVTLQWKNPALSVRATNLARANVATVHIPHFNFVAVFPGRILATEIKSSDPEHAGLGFTNMENTQYKTVAVDWYYHEPCNDSHIVDPVSGGHLSGGHYRLDWTPHILDTDLSSTPVWPARLDLTDGKLHGSAAQDGANNVPVWNRHHGPAYHSVTGAQMMPQDGTPVRVVGSGYYMAVYTLEAKPGYTFRGFAPSMDPPTTDINNMNHQGTGLIIQDNQSIRSTNGPGINQDSGTAYYRIRRWGWVPGVNWVATEGLVQHTGKLYGVDQIKVRVSFRQAQAAPPASP
ncbi:MAG: hypothetical protein LBC88_04795 [Spirochaetaceae bacterium]|jgi:hypothetical protein|nr:hypothetical protein [Spirochaetaceae bacterium]